MTRDARKCDHCKCKYTIRCDRPCDRQSRHKLESVRLIDTVLWQTVNYEVYKYVKIKKFVLIFVGDLTGKKINATSQNWAASVAGPTGPPFAPSN